MKRSKLIIILSLVLINASLLAQGTRLLREPDISGNKVVFTYGSDIWVSDLDGDNMLRLTSTQAVESNPFFSPDGEMIAFTSNRNGGNDVVNTLSLEVSNQNNAQIYASSGDASGSAGNAGRMSTNNSASYIAFGAEL